MRYLSPIALAYCLGFFNLFAVHSSMARESLCHHQSLDHVFKLSLHGKQPKQYKALVNLLQKKALLKPDTDRVFQAFIDCVDIFNRMNSEFDFVAMRGKNGALDLNYADGEWLTIAPGSLNKLHKTIKKAEKKLGIYNWHDKNAFWFLWVESTIAATAEPFNYYVYADQIEYEQFTSGGRSFAVGFSPKRGDSAMIVDSVSDDTLINAGLIPGVEITNIFSGSVKEKSQFSWWLQQAPFSYVLEFKLGDELKTVQATSVPFEAKDFVATYWGDIAYIRINSFNGRSSVEMSRFMRDVSAKAKGIILDLRFNGGGVVSPMIVDYFLKPSQEILVYKYLQEDTVRLPGSVAYTHLPLAILQNRYSASMSEVISAAIQAQRRGIVIGEASYGKGVGQTMYPVWEEGALALVETQFYYPDGEKTWHKIGVQPDVAVEVNEDDMNILMSHLHAELMDLDEMVNFDQALLAAKNALTKKMAGF